MKTTPQYFSIRGARGTVIIGVNSKTPIEQTRKRLAQFFGNYPERFMPTFNKKKQAIAVDLWERPFKVKP